MADGAAAIPVTEFVYTAGGRDFPLVVIWTSWGDGGRLMVGEVSAKAPVDMEDVAARKIVVACEWITDGLRRGQTLAEIAAQGAGDTVSRLARLLQVLEARGWRGGEAVSGQRSAVSEKKAEGCRLTAESSLGPECAPDWPL